MANRHPRRPYSPYRWFTVERGLRCWLGNHTAEPGTRMRAHRDPQRAHMPSCADCLAKQGVHEPPPAARPFTFRQRAAQDVRGRQVGEDE